MTTFTRSNVSDQYVQKVMRLIHAPEPDRQRIEADLEAHLKEGMEAGEDMTALLERMGDPREVAAGFMTEIPQVYAGFWIRLAAFMIDFGLILVVAILFSALFAFISNYLVPPHPQAPLEKYWGGFLIVLELILANAVIAMIMAYFPLVEARFGQTLGKRLLHLHVLAENGLPITTGQAILRRLSFFFQIFPIDALFVLFNSRKQRGFDILARTVVVKES